MINTILKIINTVMHIRTAIFLGFCIVLSWSTACFLAKANVNGILITCNRSIKKVPIVIISDVVSELIFVDGS